MALSRAHISAKIADVAKPLLLNTTPGNTNTLPAEYGSGPT